MQMEKYKKESFVVIGKEGSTNDGEGFIQKLWEDANGHFNEVEALAKKDENGCIVGVWGAMTDMSHSFKPWEEQFAKGLYLAGVEVREDAEVPEGWVKWVIPGFEYLRVKVDCEDIFPKMIAYMAEHNIELVGAVHEFNDPKENGQAYMLFPIRKLEK